ncbi:MAG: hypothetical protein NXH97_00590 [Rhodobacteraceae bacterium]|nr:hypothetical protein [Paracoccaceae bacterium]
MSTFDRATHEIHTRRWGRNLGLGIVLVGFVAVVFGLTLAKVSTGANMEAFDHVARPALIPAE